MAPVDIRPPFPGSLQDPTVEDLEKLLATPVESVTTLVASSSSRQPVESKKGQTRRLSVMGIDLSEFDTIINVGKSVWDAFRTQYDMRGATNFATGLPRGVQARRDWEQLEGWRDFSTTWDSDSHRNGERLLHFETQISLNCNATYHARGAYIDNLQVRLLNSKAGHYGKVSGHVLIGDPVNSGSLQHPVAKLPVTVHVHASGSWFYDDIDDELECYVLGTCLTKVGPWSCQAEFDSQRTRCINHEL